MGQGSESPGRSSFYVGFSLCYTCIVKRRLIMLAIRLPPAIEKRLAALAKRTGRSKTYYAREAILEHLDDLEDYYLAVQRLEKNVASLSLKELERRLGVAD